VLHGEYSRCSVAFETLCAFEEANVAATAATDDQYDIRRPSISLAVRPIITKQEPTSISRTDGGMMAYSWAITRATTLAVAMLPRAEGGFISEQQTRGVLQATRYIIDYCHMETDILVDFCMINIRNRMRNGKLDNLHLLSHLSMYVSGAVLL